MSALVPRPLVKWFSLATVSLTPQMKEQVRWSSHSWLQGEFPSWMLPQLKALDYNQVLHFASSVGPTIYIRRLSQSGFQCGSVELDDPQPTYFATTAAA